MSSDFRQIYDNSIKKPEDFWKEISEDIFWFKKPTQILNNENPNELRDKVKEFKKEYKSLIKRWGKF